MLSASDKYLLESIQQGDYKAYAILFKSYYSSFCKYAMSLVHNWETAEDLVSDLFVKIWEQPDNFMVSSSLKQYLFRCVHNSCINHLTRTQFKFQNLNPETVEKLNTQIPLISEENSYTFLLVSEFEKQLLDAIDKLPAECARIFNMSRKEGLSHKRIARELNISENTVKVQIYRALIKLRAALQIYFD